MLIASEKDRVLSEEAYDHYTEGLWLIHGMTGKAIKYPTKHEPGDITAEMLFILARRAIVQLDIEVMEKQIKHLETRGNEISGKAIDELTNTLTAAMEELKFNFKHYDEIKGQHLEKLAKTKRMPIQGEP